ncbi:unnamed protein product [Rotaria socialis]|uniref:Uncharacterized protein n=1 Tax=Rotaria socialis TaxID=392032 RepID=A0A821JLS8_9BILA|nr:unnamed protein product [Rotaria socialis]CAF4720046.1 unnamed protein product [Rotaria socialis]
MTTAQQLHPDLKELSQMPNTIFCQVETAIKTSTKLTDDYRKQCLQACCNAKDSFFRAQIDFTDEGQRLITRAMKLPVTDENNRRILHGEWKKMMIFTKTECKLILEPVQQIVQYLLKTDRFLGSIVVTVALLMKFVTVKQIRDSVHDTLQSVKEWISVNFPKCISISSKELKAEELLNQLNDLLHFMETDETDWLSDVKLECLQQRINIKNAALKQDRERFCADNKLQ